MCIRDSINRTRHIHAERIVFIADCTARVDGEITAGGDGVAGILRLFKRILGNLFERIRNGGQAVRFPLRLVGRVLGHVDQVLNLIQRILPVFHLSLIHI